MSNLHRWLSYLTELHVETADSELSPHLYVSIRNGRYQLSTHNAVYSYADKYDNFRRSFEQMDLDALPGERVLLLGFGLGSIPFMLERRFEKIYDYTGVELDPAVIYLASKYTLPDLESRIELVQADAALFLEMREETYDLICMDVFLDQKVPRNMETREFLQLLHDRLNPGGTLLYNRIAVKPSDQAKNRQVLGRMRRVFPVADYFDVKTNWVLRGVRSHEKHDHKTS